MVTGKQVYNTEKNKKNFISKWQTHEFLDRTSPTQSSDSGGGTTDEELLEYFEDGVWEKLAQVEKKQQKNRWKTHNRLMKAGLVKTPFTANISSPEREAKANKKNQRRVVKKVVGPSDSDEDNEGNEELSEVSHSRKCLVF